MAALSLSDFFVAAGAKTLRATEVDPMVSNGHELQGISRFRQFLGQNEQNDVLPVTYVWLSDEDPPASLPLTGTWYDSRRDDPARSAEYRFYYPADAEPVVYRAKAGDTLFLCKPTTGPLLALFCAAGSTIEQQLLYLFRLTDPLDHRLIPAEVTKNHDRNLDFVTRYLLELIGVEIVQTEDDLLDRLLARFGTSFPLTSAFSAFARDHLPDVDGRADPDAALLTWIDFEERLFMTLKKHIVGERLRSGFMQDDQPDVDAFIRYSLSVQNRRKSRAGYALGHHIEALLTQHGLHFVREARTEKRAGPDFLFPSEEAYHSDAWQDDRLAMLAAKTSCKDRWRQVLAEADRIPEKHLLTLEPGISVTQTDEMKKANLALVVPERLHDSYRNEQREWLLSFREFIDLVRERQA